MSCDVDKYLCHACRESMATLSCHSGVASGQKEESSDESTIISSRTSTLTRSQGTATLLLTILTCLHSGYENIVT